MLQEWAETDNAQSEAFSAVVIIIIIIIINVISIIADNLFTISRQ